MNIHFLLIVKNEAHVIERCLDSLLPAAPDSIVVHDTGSTDDTRSRASTWAHQNDIPMCYRDVPWVDFATNRSNLFAHAYVAKGAGDYLWVIDADDVLVFGDENPAKALRAQLASGPDIADVPFAYGSLRYTRPQVVRNNRPWRYRGVVHEFLDIPPGITRITLVGVTDTPVQDGARSHDPAKFQKDADALISALQGGCEPDLVPRYQFYLAQCLRDARRLRDALEAYIARVDNPEGYQEERYVAAYNVVRLAPHVYPNNRAEEYKAICCVLDGLECSPERWELRHDLISWMWKNNKYQFARHLLPGRPRTKAPPPGLFVEPAIYQWSMADQAAIVLFYVGEYEQSFWVCHDLLVENKHLPVSERWRILTNMRWAADFLSEEHKRIYSTLLKAENP